MLQAESGMKIGGFHKNSLIDFPGTIACVVYTQGCNFICPYCHNPELIAGPRKGTGNLLDETEIFSFLEKRKGLIQGVAITGGEPTLQTDLVEFCSKVREMGFKIKLDTNGTHPDMVSRLIDQGLVDFIAMDIKTSLENYSGLAPSMKEPDLISQTIRIIMKHAPDYEFRTTCVRPFINSSRMHEIGKMIRGANRYALQKCSSHDKILNPDFLKQENALFSDDEMVELKEIAETYISNVLIR